MMEIIRKFFSREGNNQKILNWVEKFIYGCLIFKALYALTVLTFSAFIH